MTVLTAYIPGARWSQDHWFMRRWRPQYQTVGPSQRPNIAYGALRRRRRRAGQLTLFN